MDEGIRRGQHFQRVYQYARRLEAKSNLDKFQFDEKIVEGDSEKSSSLKSILR